VLTGASIHGVLRGGRVHDARRPYTVDVIWAIQGLPAVKDRPHESTPTPSRHRPHASPVGDQSSSSSMPATRSSRRPQFRLCMLTAWSRACHVALHDGHGPPCRLLALYASLRAGRTRSQRPGPAPLANRHHSKCDCRPVSHRLPLGATVARSSAPARTRHAASRRTPPWSSRASWTRPPRRTPWIEAPASTRGRSTKMVSYAVMKHSSAASCADTSSARTERRHHVPAPCAAAGVAREQCSGLPSGGVG